MEIEKKLTICIPTYNRAKFIERQLTFFEEEFKNNQHLAEHVNCIVADNASSDNTAEFLSRYNEENNFFEYQTNSDNLGLVGNIVNLLGLSRTEYVWFVSDDDDLKPGIVKKILEIISSSNNLDFILLNISVLGKKNFQGKSGLRTDAKKAAMEVFREHYGSLVLMSACIYKRENLMELSDNKMFKWLAAPLLYSFYSCTKGHAYITDDIWIHYRYGDATYAGFKTISKLKFEEFVPILEYLPNLGYDECETKKTIKKFFEQQSHAHLLYNWVNLKNSIRLYKYYGIRTFLAIPGNIAHYLRKNQEG